MDWSRRVFEASAGGLWIVDLQGRTLDANAATAALLGVTPERLGRMGLDDFLDVTGRGQLAEHLGVLRAGRVNAAEVECLFHRADGTTVWAQLREALLLGQDGGPVAVVLNVEDVSDRKKLLDDLQNSESKRVEAEQVARLGTWEWDVAGDGIDYSDGIVRLYGDRAATVFATYDSFVEAVHPEDRARVVAAIRRVLDGEPSFEFEARVHAERGYIWIYSRGVGHRDADGVVRVVLGTHLDVTQVRDTDDALRDLVNQNTLMQTVASAANEATTLVEVLREARSMVLLHDDWDRARAFTPTSDGLDLDLVEVDGGPGATTGDVMVDRERRTALRCLRERHAVWDDETNLTLAFPVVLDDEVVAVVAITSLPPLYRHDMIASMAADVAVQLARVAERERSARELAEARDRALNASQQKSTFLSTMSHEIRTPLHGVIGLTELLGRTTLDEQQQHLISGIDLSSRALLAVISDVLDFSKIEAGRLELETVDYEVRAVLDQVAAVLAESARGQDLELTLSCSPDVPQVASGDPHRLAQVLTNLGSNAVKFTPSGAVAVRATTVVDDGRRMLRVQVRDTGIGVPDDRQGSIFEPFSQADASTTRQYGGTGLGLAISAEIVAALGGEIGLESAAGRGSTFWFTIPLPEPRGELLGETLAGTRRALQGLHVLVVDDLVTNLHILTEQLAWWGVASVSASDAAAAVRALDTSSEVFDAVILDMAMPEVDGLMLADMIRADHRHRDVAMVMLTSSLPLDDAVLAGHGIGHCLSKPVSSSLLCDVLLSIRQPPAGPGAPRRPTATRKSQQLLIVEDNPVNRIVASGFLDALGYTAATAENGADALEMLESVDYDLVLMDVQMPGIDGYATTRILRDREKRLGLRRTPVVAMTAAAFKGERERALDAGMDDFMTKPVTGARVASMISRWVVGDGGAPAATPSVAAPAPVVPPGGATLDRARLADLAELSPDGSYLRRAAASFVERAPGMLAAVHDAMTPGALSAAAHALRGTASNLGAARISEIAGSLESLGRQERSTDPTLLADLDEAMADALVALDEHQGRDTPE